MLSQIQRALRRRRYQAAPTEDTEPKSPTSPSGNDKKVEGFHFYSSNNSRKQENSLTSISDRNRKYADTKEVSTQRDCMLSNSKTANGSGTL